MEKPDFDQIISRRQSDSVKWNAYPDSVLPLWVADMDFRTPEVIIEAIRERLEHPFFGYGKCSDGVLENICKWLQKRYDWTIEAEAIMPLAGVVSGFNWVIYAFCKPGMKYAIQTPVYPPFYKVSENTGVKCMQIPLIEGDNRYEIDYDLFEEKIRRDISVFLLCNPHNPVGRVYSKEELNNLGDICARNEIIICSDEIHSDLVYSGKKHMPIASLSTDFAKRTITLMAPSKTFNIPGLQFSFAVVEDKDLRESLNHSKAGMLGQPGLLANVAASAAFAYGEEWLEELLDYLESNRDFALAFINREMPEIRLYKPEGTYLLWLDCSELKITSSPFDFFLNQARVALNDGKSFGDDCSRFVRLNFACPRQLLEDALIRMRDAVLQTRLAND